PLYFCFDYLRTFYCISFFFYCSGHHRDLHSFPTRRSSDLGAVRFCPQIAGFAHLSPVAFTGRIWHSSGRCRRICRRQFLPDAGVDRKSTRLNSSHVAISYAVFCLKKKKKKKKTKYSNNNVK